jgi:predicted metal-binding membrane protein
MLMALLFVGGLMNMFWIAGLALLVLVEKLFPFGRRVSQVTGAALIGWGVFVLVH